MNGNESVTMLSRVSLCDTPWHSAGGGTGHTASGRPTLVTPHDILRVHATGCRDLLPLLDVWENAAGRWKRFELPAAAGENAAAINGMLDLSLEAVDGRRQDLTVRLADPLRRLSPPTDDDAIDTSSSDTQSAPSTEGKASAVEELIDRHMSFVSELQHRPPVGDWTWTGAVHHGTLRPLGETLIRWAASADRSEPRMALIVRLAEQLPSLIADLCSRPRRVLGRVRESVPASRVQQLDGACLRWLARQPGRTVAEKAGSKQTILGVARRESTDTPENRVLRDFLVRGIRACGRYVREHRHARNHGRVLRVMRFRRLMRVALKDSAVAAVRPLAGAAQANYVLQHDARYQPMWEAYVQLVRQEAEQDRIWRWRHRLWAEHCRLGLLNALRSITVPGVALRSDALFHGEQDAGQFFRPQTGAASWRFYEAAAGELIDVVHGSEAANHPLAPSAVRGLAPDTIIICRHGERVVQVGLVFSQLAFDSPASDALEVLASRIAELPASLNCRAVLLTPALGRLAMRTAGQARQIELPVPTQDGAERLIHAIDWLTAGPR